jgi:hypothetical protein
MTQELLGRVHRELLDVLNSINQDKIHHDGDDFHELLNDVEKALAQPERHELQAKGEHPAPCARHCEANAFQIVIKNLKAQLAQRKPLTLDQIYKALLSICDDGSAPTSTDDPEFVELIVPLARAIEAAHGIKGDA